MDNKALKIGVISGIISSLLVIIFINPILSLVWKITVAVAGSVHQGYVDRIYKNAALTNRNEFGRVTMLAVLSLGLVMGMFAFLAAYDWGSHPLTIGIRRVFRVSTWLSAGMFLVLAMIQFSILQGTEYINVYFTQRLTILAPAIDDSEYKTLKAWWASMQSKADFDAIVALMDKRAKELSVTLPPV